MKRLKYTIAAASLLLLAACGGSGEAAETTATNATVAAVKSLDDTHADSNDADYDGGTTITLADGASTVDGEGASVDGDVVTITAAGTYVVSGTLSDGQIVVDSEDDQKVRLVLDGVDITSASSSPIVVTQSDETVVILEGDNTLSDSAASGDDDEEEDAPNATLWSADDLTIAGTGSLTVKGLSNDGITSKDGLVILSGTVTVDAVDDGIRGKDYLFVEDGTLDVTAGGDGFKADNETEGELGWFQFAGGEATVSAGSDGVDAVGDLVIADGTFTVAESEEGLEGQSINVAGGTVDITSSDDGLNATTTTSDETSTEGDTGGGPGGGGPMGDQAQEGVMLAITGGETHIKAEGDGLDSNGAATITGGTISVDGPLSAGNGALDVNGTFTVDGGTLIAGGSSGMPVVPSTDSQQGWIAANLDVTEGQEIEVRSGDDVIVSTTANQQIQLLVVSAAGIESGESYDVYVDGTKAATVTADEFEGGGMRGGDMMGGGGGPQGGGQPPQGR